MNTHILERILLVVTVLLFVLSVFMFITCFVIQPRILADMESMAAAERVVETASVSPSEPLRAEIVTLVERYEPSEIEVPETVEEIEIVDEIEDPIFMPVTYDIPEEPIVEDLEAESVEVVEGDVEEQVYFDVDLDHDLQTHIFATCEEYGVDPALIMAVIEKESGFVEDVVGDQGRSLGLMQVQPQWFQEQMAAHGFDNLLDPYQNVVIGIEYLASLMAMGKGDTWALMAYNGGPSYADARGDNVSGYARFVLERWEYYGSK